VRLGAVSESSEPAERARVPLVSAVMPCRNEERGIERTILSILEQDLVPGGFELVVADGMSDDGTRDILKRLANSHATVRLVDNERRITPAGMNRGIEAAKGRYIAILGAHSIYARDYLAKCRELADRTGADNVGGAVHTQADTYIGRAIAAAHHSWFSVGGAHWHNVEREGPAESVWGGFYRREVFERIGLFDEEFVRNQDDEFNLRLTKSGGRIWQSPEISSQYSPRGSLRALFRQYRQYGYWKVRVIQKHRLPASWRHLAPAVATIAGLGLVLAAAIQTLYVGTVAPGSRQNWATLALLAAVFTYSIAALVSAAIAARKAGWDLLPILPVVFAAYHLGYGIGFIQGLLDFVVLGKRSPGQMGALTR
jgi:succinoglycan biosynthesis protein ExoA